MYTVQGVSSDGARGKERADETRPVSLPVSVYLLSLSFLSSLPSTNVKSCYFRSEARAYAHNRASLDVSGIHKRYPYLLPLPDTSAPQAKEQPQPIEEGCREGRGTMGQLREGPRGQLEGTMATSYYALKPCVDEVYNFSLAFFPAASQASYFRLWRTHDGSYRV